MTKIFGLSGNRGVGKSTILKALVDKNPNKYKIVHPFDGGKAMIKGYYTHLGVPLHIAEEMVNGRFKDTPYHEIPSIANLEYLPGVNSRQFMEYLGKFLYDLTPEDMEYTLAAEIGAQEAFNTNSPKTILVDSCVYECNLIRQRGGAIIEITNNEGGFVDLRNQDLITDKFKPIADYIVVNERDKLGSTVERIEAFMEDWNEDVVIGS